MDILIRKATPEDLDLVTHIEATCFLRQRRHLVRRLRKD